MIRLDEKTRQQIIDQSKKADIVKKYGTTRWDRRHKQQVSRDTRDYNRIDMDSLFRGKKFTFTVKVKGETDTYYVTVAWDNLLSYFNEYVKKYNKLDLSGIYSSIVKSIREKDIYLSCTCKDWQFRFAYYATKDKYNSGSPEVRAADITNPNNSKGAGCKHVMAVIDDWNIFMKLAICIDNYMKWIQRTKPNLYKDIIEPAVYGTMYSVVDDTLDEPEEISKEDEPMFNVEDEDIDEPTYKVDDEDEIEYSVED